MCLKLVINFIEFIHDRVRGLYKIPRLAQIIRQRAMHAFELHLTTKLLKYFLAGFAKKIFSEIFY